MISAAKAAQLSASRMIGLSTAASLLGGQRQLGDALNIGERAVRSKLSADRGITGEDLTLAAIALRQRAARLAQHAAKLDALVTG